MVATDLKLCSDLEKVGFVLPEHFSKCKCFVGGCCPVTVELCDLEPCTHLCASASAIGDGMLFPGMWEPTLGNGFEMLSITGE